MWLHIPERMEGARSRPAVVALAAALAVATLLLAGAVPDAGAIGKQKIKKQVKRELVKRGLTVKRLLPCRKRGPRRYRCEWRAEGTYTGGPQFSCRGFATYFTARKRKRRLRVDRCLNADLWDILLEQGLNPTAILKPSIKGGVVRMEWRASGVAEGGVPYNCKNIARWDRGKAEWRPGSFACDSRIDRAEPLLDEPGPHPVFGFNDDWAHQRDLDRIPMATAIGARTLRFTIEWGNVEKSPGAYDWRNPDTVMAAMAQHGVIPLPIVITAPCWAQENPGECSPVGAPKRSEVGRYADFVAAVATRYPGVLAIEVWNEPNWKPYFAPKPDPALYSRMVTRAADAVKATGTGVPVITGGLVPLANSSRDGTKLAFAEFMRRVYAEGGIGSAAAVSYHIYFGNVDDHNLKLRQQIASLRQVMEANGNGSKPISITEIGIESDGRYTPQSQADHLVSFYDTLRHIANIPVVIVHRFFEAKTDLTAGIDRRGVIDVDGNRKLAYCALGRAVEVFPADC